MRGEVVPCSNRLPGARFESKTLALPAIIMEAKNESPQYSHFPLPIFQDYGRKGVFSWKSKLLKHVAWLTHHEDNLPRRGSLSAAETPSGIGS